MIITWDTMVFKKINRYLKFLSNALERKKLFSERNCNEFTKYPLLIYHTDIQSEFLTLSDIPCIIPNILFYLRFFGMQPNKKIMANYEAMLSKK